MKKIKTQFVLLIAIIIGITPVLAKKDKQIKLTTIKSELIVNVSKEEAWKVINSYSNVGDFHSGVTSSKAINGSPVIGEMGCERQCYIQSGKKEFTVDEKIIEFKEGSHYKYEAHSDDFPAKAFYNTFGVTVNTSGQTIIYVKSEYRLKPGFMTGLAKGKLTAGNEDALLFYKHFMETGEKNADAQMIKEKYQKS